MCDLKNEDDLKDKADPKKHSKLILIQYVALVLFACLFQLIAGQNFSLTDLDDTEILARKNESVKLKLMMLMHSLNIIGWWSIFAICPSILCLITWPHLFLME